MWCQKITNSDQNNENPTDINNELTGINEELTWFDQELTWVNKETIKPEILSFEDCLNAGFPILNNYPRECNDWTNIFIEEKNDEILVIEEDLITSGNIENNEIESNTWENKNDLQSKLKAVLERRKKEAEAKNQNETEPKSTNNDNITEEDIEKLEDFINKVIQ